jgi:transcriptional regulator with XRE-family HTH domain
VELSERIKRWREDCEFTQAALAKRIGVSPSAVAQWEIADGTEPTHQNVEKIADALGISVSQFWAKVPAAKRKRAS